MPTERVEREQLGWRFRFRRRPLAPGGDQPDPKSKQPQATRDALVAGVNKIAEVAEDLQSCQTHAGQDRAVLLGGARLQILHSVHKGDGEAPDEAGKQGNSEAQREALLRGAIFVFASNKSARDQAGPH